MKRIDTPSAVVDLFGTGKNGFMDRDPGVAAGTVLDFSWANHAQEEIARAVEDTGGAVDSAQYDQLAKVFRLHQANVNLANSEAQSPAGFTTGDHVGCGASNGSYYLLGAEGSGGAERSADGETWASAISSQDVNGIATDGTDFLAVGDSAYLGLLNSSASLTGTATAAGSYSDNFQGCAYGSGVWVAVGNSGEIQTSPDRSTWTQRTAAASYSDDWDSIVWDGSQFVAYGGGREIQTSPDGITWTQRRAADSSTFRTSAYGNGVHLACDGSGAIWRSADGVSWATVSGAPVKLSVSFIPALRVFLLSGSSFGGETRAYLSADGVGWLPFYLRTGLDASDIRVAIGGPVDTAHSGLIVLGGDDGTIELGLRCGFDIA